MCVIVLSGDVTSGGLSLSWTTLFQIFMFSLSLSTGLQPEIAPLSPYTLVLANFNALFAQLIFVFLSGAGIILLTVSCNLELPRMHVVASELLLSNLHFYEHVLYHEQSGRQIKFISLHVLRCSVCEVVAAFTTRTVLNCCINLSISCSAQTKGG